MRLALEEAEKAAQRDEVPIGALMVNKTTGAVISQAGNATRALFDPTAHAEILAIRAAAEMEQTQRLPDYDLYVTLEPCPMCAAAISYARIHTIIYGAHDPKSGGISSGPCLYEHSQMHHKPNVISGILEQECSQILKNFFAQKRQK